MPHSTARDSRRKPPKPYPDFPLFAHSGRWGKKIRGKVHYFGKWDNWQAALEKYLEQRDDLHAGRKPRQHSGGLSVDELANRFLAAKKSLVESGELTARSWDDYKKTAARIKATFGATRSVVDLRADDFEALRAALAKGRSPSTLGNEIQRCRVIFKYAFDAGLITAPVRYGPTFKRPSRRIMRLERAKAGAKMFEADELRRIIEAADDAMRAMVLLAANCGLGNCDCGKLTLDNVDLQTGWLDFPRPKTGVPRRAKLWPETCKALEAAIAKRPSPKLPEHGRLIFLTKYRQPWAKESRDNPVSVEFRKLLQRIDQDADAAKLYRPGRGFYALRHGFATVAGETRDQVAVNHIMGHDADDMASRYRERISDERLEAVAAHVRAWLFGGEAGHE